ncbi:hypothetical protein [Mucilaginibacter gilvus]|uniref:MG2 domain-containing protein n=1 Tax=Mucilaginibacter gilvus TaxID=2305909 RepID=A0A3S3VTW0_9SPHI|nr:hypothetical protein [Mucilaginibacter gilvus]RWY55779.1 hypothetical protein EPL05_05230 [Mucilaginibacter gilvus]
MNQLSARLFCFVIASLFANLCIAQTIDEMVNYQIQKNPQEKIYIHYDKNSYVTGDTLRFKAYVFSGSKRSTAGKNFYLELLNDKGKVMSRVTAPVFESTASGNLVLPIDSVSSAFYCRAYTESMLRSDSSFIYTKALSVINMSKSQANVNAGSTRISFLPEGGDWVENVPGLIAFKVTDANGMPVNASGVIKSGNDVMADFATTHDGMGFFAMSPQPNQTYTAVWKDNNGQEHNTPLPKAKLTGVSLHVENITAGKKFYVFRSPTANDADKQLTLIVYANGNIFYQVNIDLSARAMSTGTIPTKELPTGILYLTVFNKNKRPVAERVTFVNNHDHNFQIDTSLTINKAKRGLNQVKLAIKDTIRSNFSIAVTDAEQDPISANADNIVSHLLLTADLHGKIVNPYYYFTDKTENADKNLDLVMLTHGWRKYNWGTDTAKVPADTVTGYRFISIKGKLNGLGELDKEAYGTVTMQTDTNSVMLPMVVNKSGYFFRDGLIYYGDAKLFFKFVDKRLNANSVKLSVDNGLIKSFPYPFTALTPDSAAATTPPALSPRMQDYLFQLKNTRSLKEVQVKSTKVTQVQKLEKTYTSGVFKDGISTTIKVGDDPRFLNYSSFFQYLQGKIPGMVITYPLTTPQVMWRNEAVYFFLNGFQVDVSDIAGTAMNDFDYVKIYDPSMGGTFRAPGAVISVYTKHGKGFVFDSSNKKMIILPGYTTVKEFFSPDYASGIMVSKPDLRTTLYWNPNIIMDKENHEYTIKFYNNDVTRKFKIVLEGINFDGKLIHLEKAL